MTLEPSAARLVIDALPCSVELPAGCGKTYTIGQVVMLFAKQGKRTLILTHTHAGVEVLRRRLRGIGRNSYAVRTIDSWCVDLLRSYPMLAGIKVPDEPNWSESSTYHRAGACLVERPPLINMIHASYEALIVDEYQDCQTWQHQFILSISQILPTAVFGDRMQGLLYFGRNEPVSWEVDVEPIFPSLVLEIVPQRWRTTNPRLGIWLVALRERLMRGEEIDLHAGPVEFRSMAEATQVLKTQPKHPIRICGIGLFPKDCQTMANRLAGDYTMIEELEGRFLLNFADVVDSAVPPRVARETAQFAVDSAYGVADVFTSADRQRLGSGRPLTGSRASRVAEQANALNRLLSDCSPEGVRSALRAISRLPNFCLTRREAWLGIDRALSSASREPELTVRSAVVLQRNRMRLTGRYPESRILARPLLIKGLEFNRAVVLDADKFNAHELYVALTRGSDHVIVLASRAVVRPSRPG